MRRIRRQAAALVLAAGALALASCGRGPSIAPDSTLVLTLEGDYAEGADAPLLARVLGGGEQSLLGLYSAFRKAERDERLAGVLLRVRGLDVGWGRRRTCAARSARLAREGQAHRRVPRAREVRLEPRVLRRECGATQVYARPACAARSSGMAAELFFLGGLFEKLGMTVEYERVGKYKTAVDQFAAKEMSDANREMAERDARLRCTASSCRRRRVAKPRSRAAGARSSTAAPTVAGGARGREADRRRRVLRRGRREGRPEARRARGLGARRRSRRVGFSPQATFALI